MPTSLSMSSVSDSKSSDSGVDVKSRAALGGYELINTQVPNQVEVDATPVNNTITGDGKGNGVDSNDTEPHPAQIQNMDDSSIQSLTKVDDNEVPPPDDIDDFMKNSPSSELDDVVPSGDDIDAVGIGSEDEIEIDDATKAEDDIEIPDDGDDLGLDGEDTTNELQETFSKHSRLMREKLGLDEKKKKDKEIIVGEKEKGSVSDKKLKKIHERLTNKSRFFQLNEVERKITEQIEKTLKFRNR